MGGNYYFGYWISNMDMILLLLAIIAINTGGIGIVYKNRKPRKNEESTKKPISFEWPGRKEPKRKIEMPEWLEEKPLR